MPKVPRPSDMAAPRLDQAGGAAQLNVGVASAIGSAGKSMGNAIASIGSAFGEVAGRLGEAQENNNYSDAKLEWMKGDYAIQQDIMQNAGEDGALWQTAPDRYKQLNDDIGAKYPINSPEKRRSWDMWRETQTFERGINAVKTYQGAQRGQFLKGFEQDLQGFEQRIEKGDIDPATFGELYGVMNEKLSGMNRTVLHQADVEAKTKEMQGRLTGAVDAFMSKKAPQERAQFWDSVSKGQYEINQPAPAVQPFRPTSGLNGQAIQGGRPMDVAKSFLGAHEGQDTEALSGFFKKAGGQHLNPADTAWCAAFVNATLGATGQKGTGSLLARDFLKVGTAVDKPSEGDIVVLSRGDRNGWQGHVGFYAGRDASGNVLVLGGNQSNKVSVAPYSADRVLGFRRPPSAGTNIPGLDLGGASPQAGGTRVDQAGVELIKKLEGSKDQGWDYKQFSGPYGVKRGEGETMTPAQAEGRMKDEIGKVESDLAGKIKVPLTQGQHNALVSFFYNLGTGKGRLDEVADMINNGRAADVPAYMASKTKAGGEHLDGLANRRKAEIEMFNSGGPAQAQGQPKGTQVAALTSGTMTDAAPEAGDDRRAKWASSLTGMAAAKPGQMLSDIYDGEQASELAALLPKGTDLGKVNASDAAKLLGSVKTADASNAPPANDNQVSGTQPTVKGPAMIPEGRLVGGQTFSVKTPKGEFRIPAEWINALPAATKKEYARRAHEEAKIYERQLKSDADEMMANQEAYVAEHGKNAPGYDFRAVEAAYAADPKKIAVHARRVRTAQELNREFKNAADLPDDELVARIERLAPSESSPNYAESKDIFDKAEKRLHKLMKSREMDPGGSVEGSKDVMAVRERLVGGQPRNKLDQIALMSARLAAQRRLDISEDARNPLTADETRALAAPLRGLNPGDAMDRIEEVHKGIKEKYGDKYSGLILRKVIETTVKDKTRRESFGSILTELDESGAVSPSTMARIREQEEIAAGARKLPEKPAPKPANPGILERLQRGYRGYMDAVTPKEVSEGWSQGVIGPLTGKPAPGKPLAVPRSAVDHLKQNPRLAPDFERKYNLPAGSARKYLLQ